MNAGQKADFCVQGTDVGKPSSVNALALKQPLADNKLLNFVYYFAEHRNLLGILLVKLCVNFVKNFRNGVIAHHFVIGVKRGAHLVNAKRLNFFKHIVVKLARLILKLGLAYLGLDVVYKLNHLLVFFVRGHNCVIDNLVFNLITAGLNHYNLCCGRGNGYIHLVYFLLLGSGVENNLAVNKARNNAGNRPVPRNIRNRKRDRGADKARNLGRAVGVNRHNGKVKRYVVAQIFREKGADGSVNNTRRQNGLVTGLALAL